MNSGLALGYVFGLGMVAVFNPCGFAMLPAWVAYFVASDQESTTAHRGVLRALTVVAVLTAGFVAVFLVVGLMIQLTASSLVSRLPWLSVALGAAMVLLSIWLFRGRELNMPNPWARRGPRSRAHREVFLFGVSYAFVSLTCTIPLFLAAVTTSLTTGSIGVGILHFVAYACGMGLILTVLTLAVSLARETVVRHMRRVTPHMKRVAAVLLGVAGLYVAYYGWYSLRVKPCLLHRQPPLGQVLPERELLAHHGLAPVGALHQLREQLLCIAAPRARLHPPAPVLARRRIHAVVHNGVPLLALLLDGSAHQRPLRIEPDGDIEQRTRPAIPRRPAGIWRCTFDHTPPQPEDRPPRLPVLRSGRRHG